MKNNDITSKLLIATAGLCLIWNNPSAADPAINDRHQTIDGNASPLTTDLLNLGLIINMTTTPSVLTNEGNILFTNKVTCSESRIFNKPGGTVIFNHYIDCYEHDSTKNALLENDGTILITGGVGYKVGGSPNFANPIATINPVWTYVFDGKIVNKSTGKFIANRDTNHNPNPNLTHNLIFSNGPYPVFENAGYFEIGANTIWDTSEYDTNRGGSYKQTGGELRVDGVFGANLIDIQGGTISGSGLIQGRFKPTSPNNPYFYLGNTGISPGSASKTGILTLAPDGGDYLVFTSSLDIDINLNTADRLTVESGIIFINYTLNIRLRDGYIPGPGSQFTVASANYIAEYGTQHYNLPELPNGRTWDVENTGTEIILTAN